MTTSEAKVEPTLNEALESFLLMLSVAGRSKKTIDLYRLSIEPFISFLESQSLDVSPAQIREFMAHMQQHLNSTTVGIRWRSIRAFFNWLYHEGWIENSPVKRIQPPKVPKQFPNVLSAVQIQSLIRASKKCSDTWQGFRNQIIILTFLDCGLRVSELCNLAIDDLDLAQSALSVTGKGSKERKAYVGGRVARILRSWLSKRTLSLPGNALFCSSQGFKLTRHTIARIVIRLGNDAGLKDIQCSPHTLRHTFATEYIRNGGDPFSLQRLLGHSDIQTTMIYVHMAGKTLREAHSKASPIDNLFD